MFVVVSILLCPVVRFIRPQIQSPSMKFNQFRTNLCGGILCFTFVSVEKAAEFKSHTIYYASIYI
jgi:hypothetical protein